VTENSDDTERSGEGPQPERPGELTSATDRALRWFVPAVFALYAVCFFWDLSESYRRVWLAEDIANILRGETPADLDDLLALLDEHVDRVWRYGALEDCPERNDVVIGLKPRVQLKMFVELEPETDSIRDISLIYFASAEVSLDDPRADLSEPPWRESLFFLAITLCPAWLWLKLCPRPRKGILCETAMALIVLWMLCELPLAGISLMRIWF